MNVDELMSVGKKYMSSKRINRYIKSGDCVCVIESSSGKTYFGNSFSFSNFGFCAEQSALLSMFNDGEYEIKRIISISKAGDVVPPCGRCLEMISQTSNSKEIEVALSKYMSLKLIDIYPYDWKRVENYNIGMIKDVGDPFNLKRFIVAQDEYFTVILKEITNGKKVTHWIWFTFPVLKELATSVKAEYYGISSIEEANAYYQNKTLRNNLITLTKELLKLGKVRLSDVVGEVDSRKIQSCMTLFYKCTGEIVFMNVLNKFFNGEFDNQTLIYLEN